MAIFFGLSIKKLQQNWLIEKVKMFVFPAILESTEKRWLQILYNACYEQFLNSHIPSHDHLHHFRVWQNAKRLLYLLYSIGQEFSPAEVEQLMIAVFFHDTGLSVTFDEKHGKASSDICKNFFANNTSIKLPSLSKIIRMIENHENKHYAYSQVPPYSCESILAAGDDIDAFGAIGVYRYAEIYSLRNIGIENLSEKVIQNLDSRFQHLQKLYGNFEEYFNEVRLKYWITKEFYLHLKQQSKKDGSMFTEAAKVIQIFLSDIIQNRIGLKETAINSALNNTDIYVSEYFTLLATEIDKYETMLINVCPQTT